MTKIIVWALFDSGKSCYKKGAEIFDNIEIYSIGLDVENKNKEIINLNLANTNIKEIYKELNKLKKPDVIIASPPCEAFSIASAMDKGNACFRYKKDDKYFVLRNHLEYENYQFKSDLQIPRRINGEMCILNTIKIINNYQPKIYVIENPATSRIWDYIEKVVGHKIKYDNLVHYNDYDYELKKPTKFKSNIKLDLKTSNKRNEKSFNDIRSYNERSFIPINLVREIFRQIIRKHNYQKRRQKDKNLKYLEIYEDLKDKIKNNEYNKTLESEISLTKKYNVARETIRKSLELLEEEKYIKKEKGKKSKIIWRKY